MSRCREAQALTAFIWFNFLVFAVMTVFSVREIFLEATVLDVVGKTSPNRKNEDIEMVTDGPTVAEEPAQPTRPRRNFFPFRRDKGLKDGSPPVTVGVSEVGNDTDIPREQVIENEPQTADYDTSRQNH